VNLTTSYGRDRGSSGRGGYGGFRSFRPKPVEVGKEYDVDVTEVSRRGDGVARIEGFVIFVQGAKSGQKAKIRISNVSNRFATAEVVSGSTEETTGTPTE
jgi:predicted RNA-binding protein with TRAM domain